MIQRDDIRRFYDRFGSRQDSQAFYEDAANALMIRLGQFSNAQAVFELGCGTGRLAERLLSNHLPLTAHYVATDLSSTMVALATNRLLPFRSRCEVHLTDGGFDFSFSKRRFDRFVTTFVLDLLDPADIQDVLAGAHAVMRAGGLFCHAGLTPGVGPLTKTTSALWTLIHRIRPMLLGGCRPLEVATLLPTDSWRVLHREVVVRATIPSEVVIAEKR